MVLMETLQRRKAFLKEGVITINVLGLMGSPRRTGHTQQLMESFLAGVAKEGAATEALTLRSLQIGFCEGCFACWKPGGRCVKKDDMQMIYEKIEQADLLVFGTPVYWYGPTSLLKAVLDRMVFFNAPEHRLKIRRKAAVLLTAYEEEDAATGEFLAEFFARCFHYLELDFAGRLLVPGTASQGRPQLQSKWREQAFALGQEMVFRQQGCGRR